MKANANNLKKLETLLKEGGYQIRKGKGAFNSGYCLLEQKRVIVLNRYHSVDAQFVAILEIIGKVDLNKDNFSEQSEKIYAEIETQEPQE